MIFSRLDPKGVSHIWTMRGDGSGARQLTSGGGESLVDVAADGRFLTYDDDQGVLHSIPLAGGSPIIFKDEGAGRPVRNGGGFSPDGSLMVFTTDVAVGGMQRAVLHIVPAGGGAEIAADTTLPNTSSTVWGPGRGTAACVLNTDPANVVLRDFRSHTTRPLTHFTEGRILGCTFSPDLRRAALVRDIGGVRNLWVTEADGSHPVQATHFTEGGVTTVRWLPDSRRIAVLAGPRTSDAVLIRQFR
jgi:Tol biopolymer transport system component